MLQYLEMRNLYSDYTQNILWLIEESKWARKLQSIREAQFTLGNGYLGIRGIYEEIPYDCHPGTYIAGIYDKMAAQVSKIVNLPNPISFKLTVKGEKLDVIAMDVLRHKRTLNMKKGVLLRHTIYKNSKGKNFDYQSLRFVSQLDKNIGVIQVAFTPLNAGCEVDISTSIDTAVTNVGAVAEGRRKHFRVKELGQHRGTEYLVAEALEKKYSIVYWSGLYYQVNGRKIIARDNIFRLKVKKNQTVVFTKIFCIKHFNHNNDYTAQKNDAFEIFYTAFRTGFNILLKNHITAWERLWRRADIVIEGRANIQQKLRFNIYHMLICAHCNQGFSSIGARTLSGEGYRGHIFWDAEIFLLPFYLFTFPQVAKNMLLYRYQRLDQARAIAKRGGFQGAQFPWESAGTGEEETPEWARDIDRTIIKIHTHEMEHHINADISYAVYRYYIATGDVKFIEKYGCEMLVETARFWASRVQWNEKKQRYEIRHVIGPDEFHIDVNNNAFTNMMAKWNLLSAYKTCNMLKKDSDFYTLLKAKLNLKEQEVKSWKKIASKICVLSNKKNVIEQFGGFFKLKKIILSRFDENGIPLIPAKLKAKDFGKTQIIKQADVLMLITLLNDIFSKKTKLANYKFYLPRTVHRSSLSVATHVINACEVRDLHRANELFNVALNTDISNLYGNTSEGIHAASLGGSWQAIVFGFAGVKIKREKLFINPYLPRSWQKLNFHLAWRGSLINLEMTNEIIKIKVSSSRLKDIEIGIFDKLGSFRTNRVYTFKRSIEGYKKEDYY
ncbi:MAG: glycosyl hydrolase family 65 protein [Candidatus Kaelpia imicola]|nr:glycosyl hydrolase family 65 protein [Candidatus Kaelpia imicola]